MTTWVRANSFEENRFKSISDFSQSMRRGGEVEFEWKSVMYCCFGCVEPSPGEQPRMLISQAGSAEVNARTEMWGDTPDDILEYRVGDYRLRDVITEVKVWFRAI